MNGAAEHGLLARWRLVGQACTDDRLSRSDVACLWAIVDRIGRDGVAWPSLNTVADEAKASRSTVVRAIAKLSEFGYLIRESGNRTASNRYRIGQASRPTDEPRCTDEPRPTDEPSGRRSGEPFLGAEVNPEPASLNLPTEPEKKRAVRRKDQTYTEWLATTAEPDLEALADQESAYLSKIGVPPEFHDLWFAWCNGQFGADGKKRQRSWPRTLDNYLRNGWHRLWAFNRDGECYLTTAGEQLQRELAADEGRPVAHPNMPRPERERQLL